MTTALRNNIQDLPQFYNDVQNNTLPAVSFIKPDGLLDLIPQHRPRPCSKLFLRNWSARFRQIKNYGVAPRF